MLIKKLNPIKTRVFNFFTGFFINSKKIEQLQNVPKDSKIRVLISRPNHRLGNQLLISPLIQEVKNEFPNCKIDLVVNGNLSSILFSQFTYIQNIFNLPKKPFKNIFNYTRKVISLMSNKYDIAISACDDSNSSKIFVKLSRAKFKIYNSGINSNAKPTHISKIPIFNFKTILYPSQDLTNYNYSKLSLGLTNEEIEKGRSVIENLFDNEKKTICIFTFATGTKCHSKEWWSEFYEKLKKECTEFNILEMLPIENVSQIDFKSTHFYSKDLREIASVIENSTIFIGADSGMMHLSVCTNTITLGLFNVTNPNVYGPYGNKNQAIDTNTMQVNDIVETTKSLIT